ncbi:MAG: hypothetical protein WCS42_10160 [Verrucomicrobiota bacterium]
MKKIFLLTLALLALQATPQARAWGYKDGDLLLVLRSSSHNNVEYDLGSVSNFLGRANGYTTNITGWNTSVATTEFGSDLTGVKVILLATTSPANPNPTAWVSSTEPNVTAYNGSQSDWDGLYGAINGVGSRPIYPFNVTPAAATPTNAYVINPSSGASYDYTVSAGSGNGIAKLGGNAPFVVEQTVPGALDFWAVKPSAIYPNPPADKLIGTFTLAANGVLTFVAGPRASSISSISRSGNVSTVRFTTTVGNTYSLGYTNKLGGALATWPVDANTVVGDGRIDTLNHTNSSGAEFYNIKTQ